MEDRFQKEVSLDEVARRVNMTVPAFCRYFKRLTNKTFTQFVNEYRIAHAWAFPSSPMKAVSIISPTSTSSFGVSPRKAPAITAKD